MFLKAILPTPVFSRPDISSIFGQNTSQSLTLNKDGHIESLEFIALPGSHFTLEKTFNEFPTHSIFIVKADNYNSAGPLFIDSRFVQIIETISDKRTIPYKLNQQKTIDYLLSLAKLKVPYLWGGNLHKGLDHMINLYPPKDKLNDEVLRKWKLEGVDCSGLLYEATNGFTPRNCSELIHYGEDLPVLDKNIEEIDSLLKPLDLIVWPTHVIISLGCGKSIESLPKEGVVIKSTLERLTFLMDTQKKSLISSEESPIYSNEKNPFIVIKRFSPN